MVILIRNEIPRSTRRDIYFNSSEKDIESLCNFAYYSFYNDYYHNNPLWWKDNKENMLALFCDKQHNGEYVSMILTAVTENERGKDIY